MIRPFTFITMLLAALSGAYLFAVKHRAQVLDDQLAATAQDSRLDAQRIRVLQAQWALEIDPTRLAQLAARFTSLTPMQPAQLVAMASLAADLPPPGGPPPGANPENHAPSLTAAPNTALIAANGLPYPPAPPPAGFNELAVSPAHPLMKSAALHQQNQNQNQHQYQNQYAQTRSSLHLAQTHLVESLPPPRPLPFAPAPSLLTAAPVMSAQLVSVKTAAADGGSALGMAADLAPPQPLPGTGN